MLLQPDTGGRSDCTPAADVNEAFNWLILQSGVGVAKSDLMDVNDGPLQQVSPKTLEPDDLRTLFASACVYESQDDAPDFSEGTSWFVVSDTKLDHATVQEAVGSCANNTEAAIDYTDMAQGNPELVGGFVEEFSLDLADLFPKAEYAAIIQGC
ncbi:hypothetical protein FB468_1402 [Leucobacter komagatae]|uniref:Uncharacterized protein n=1 Tax=Leucobacter komagatae TaxID=55969 RepID=A0A542Y5N2_9MICO|nr:hypothetical protein [Leucobacter komagatae]TQL43381.1 hypothetical protein FB468_1402 [Leucobacter komagatae]